MYDYNLNYLFILSHQNSVYLIQLSIKLDILSETPE